jgi:hypothetical protein
MGTPEHAMTALPADRVQIIVLRVTLLAETGTGIGTPGAALTITTAGTLGSLGFSVRHCNHLKLSYRIVL